jgi:hypothetical protein
LALGLGTEGYSPRALRLIVRQGGKASSFHEASEDLGELAGLEVSPKHVERLTERVGREWQQRRDGEVEAFKQARLPRQYSQKPSAAAVMLDGGRLQTRAGGGPGGVREPAWREPKYACCMTLESSQSAADPQPDPPEKFLDAGEVVRLVDELSERRAPGRSPSPRQAHKRRRARPETDRPRVLVRTAVATLERSEDFGHQVAAEVYRRNLDLAQVKACVCDGQSYNWKLWEEHLKPLGFLAVLDFLHLLAHLYAGAQAAYRDSARAWEAYTQWLRWAWRGEVEPLLSALQDSARRLGAPPGDAPDQDPRRIVQATLGYVLNNRSRMDYPRYRRLGLPASSAPVESLIKQFNRRVKGSEKFWAAPNAEAVLQVRAAYLSQDDRAARLWLAPRPYARSAGALRLCA